MPISIEVQRLEWLEKFGQFLANTYATQNGVLIVTCDFNINLLSHQNESTSRYKNMLHSFSLQQHVTEPTRKGKTIIDPISSNIFTKLIHCNVFSADEISDHDEPYAIFNINKKYNCCGPPAFKSQRIAYQSNQKLLHHCQHSLSVQKYLMFNAFGEGYLCLLKRFLFLSIHRLYLIQFLHEIYVEKVLQEIFWAHFLGCLYHPNGTKIHQDAAL